ncbi:MAG TPA: hypothetical protein VFJ19_18905 [Nocardioidaceae bacterium]|nr:hypothetical protein [Nocardioidaceae bacterium]
MSFKIMPHGRLQEWVAEENGYFAAEGLDYTFIPEGDYGIAFDGRDDSGQIRTGAYETFGAGRSGANISCACHWATTEAALANTGQPVTSAYSVTPGAIMVAPESQIRRAEDLADVEIGVGYHSGSHFTTLQALERILPADQVKLSFQGPPNERLDTLIDRRVPAATVWGVPYYVAQALGFRTILDATFMIGFLATGDDVDPGDVQKYLNALRLAQSEIDVRPERYKHYHSRAVPARYQDQVDVRAFGTGERIVFLPYGSDTARRTHEWVAAHQLVAP